MKGKPVNHGSKRYHAVALDTHDNKKIGEGWGSSPRVAMSRLGASLWQKFDGVLTSKAIGTKEPPQHVWSSIMIIVGKD